MAPSASPIARWSLGSKSKSRGVPILLVTHEADMAQFARTIVHFRDGVVERIERRPDSGVGATTEREARA